ncbi:hypothetical protein LCGC14_2052500 [marine sediment metagenome]|uniref:Uncharacterized protein n=1 Tax=marine sediment metagenome TaxID=412755 RepID=A0A0F9HKM0_9ZZZZ
MPTEQELKDNAQAAHDNLSEDYYKNGLMSKEDFDYYHGEIWDGLETAKITAGYLTVPKLPRDLEAEIDELRAEIGELRKPSR